MRDPFQGKSGPGKSGPRSSFNGGQVLAWLGLTVVAAVLLLVVPTYFFGSDSSLHLTYSQLTAQVASGNVTSAVFAGDQVKGSLSSQFRVSNGALVPVTSGAGGSNRYVATVPQGAQADLVAQLQQHHVGISAQSSSHGISLSSAIWWVGIPALFLIGGLLLFRRGGTSTSNQSRLFTFGRSSARVYDADRPKITFADVAGEDEAKAELVQVVDFLRHPDKYHRLGAQLPRGVLMIGPPGTGKTLLAKAVAGEAGVPFFSASASEFVEMFVGVGASRVRDLFEKAKAASPAIVFLDEIDAVGRKRGIGLGGGNDEREQTLNQLLVEMDGFDSMSSVIIVAATNRPDVLDPALLRPGRFDRQVTVGLPDQRGREAILRVHLRGHPVAADVDAALVASATPGFAGADLANLVNEAALVAAARNKGQIEANDFSEALDKIVLGAERPLLMTEHEKRVIAYHEGGHALVAYLTPGADPLRKVSIVPRGRALGVTLQSPDRDRFNYSRTDLMGRLAVMFGGRMAERLVFGEITTGAENDLKEATRLARRMVQRWGMSDTVGHLVLDHDDDFYGEMMGMNRETGLRTLDAADDAVRELLETARETAERVLIESRATLDRLADVLIEEETINQARILAILGDPPHRSAPIPQAAD